MEYKERIQTERIYLQMLDPELVNHNYLTWMNDPDVTRFLESRFNPPKSLEELRHFVYAVNSSSHSLLLGIFLKSDGRHIGNIKVGPIIKEHNRSSIGYVLGDKTLWGQGIMTEAVSAVASFAISVLGLAKLTAGVYESNKGSARILKKSGFIEEASLPNHVEFEGKREVVLLFAYYGGMNEKC